MVDPSSERRKSSADAMRLGNTVRSIRMLLTMGVHGFGELMAMVGAKLRSVVCVGRQGWIFSHWVTSHRKYTSKTLADTRLEPYRA